MTVPLENEPAECIVMEISSSDPGKRQKCCAHCPGAVTISQNRDEHYCSLPKYVSGNLKLSSLRKYSPGEKEREERLKANPEDQIPVRFSSCYDNFALAKKSFRENLDHQPLPDRVSDSVFTNARRRLRPLSPDDIIEKCQRIMPRCTRDSENRSASGYGVELGCKKPITHMDLAICWNTPIDPNYEPNRPVHIDGSDGGPAPAIFTLVQHASEMPDNERICSSTSKGRAKSEPPKKSGTDKATCHPGCPCDEHCTRMEIHYCQGKNKKNDHGSGIRSKRNSQGNGVANDKTHRCNELCIGLDGIRISSGAERRSNSCPGFRPRPKHASYLRHCTACVNGKRDDVGRKSDLRKVTSATNLQETKSESRNGLPTKLIVPRPRTPYARRSFCIDSLAPPFKVVEGCRDADYPEHWRLMSVYQQSYRNPSKRRCTILNYEHCPP
ncbi:uncharacterized protein LOC105699603 [Orussus abietinus]|uniref:uncharacterized protein LOC105699603 n=1 Tax=Orussus abietinus TaxID=222816 RepID=UPI0006265B2E|nr:uncharacterized protein LOC105699603 [Orussus abietinus]